MIMMGKIYTKKGDKGRTKTISGEMGKGDQLAEVLGSIDELNSWIGYCRYQLSNSKSETLNSKQLINSNLQNVQTNLMDVASSLAGSKKKLRAGETGKLEKLIDKLDKDLPTLKNFIYPVGEIQVARAVCRRAERTIVRYMNYDLRFMNKNIIKYLNRLSDALFVIGRWVNRHNNLKEEIWR